MSILTQMGLFLTFKCTKKYRICRGPDFGFQLTDANRGVKYCFRVMIAGAQIEGTVP